MLSLPGGIHFRELTLERSYEEDISLMVALVGKRSHTPEPLDITDGYTRGMSIGFPMYPCRVNLCTSL